MRFRRIHTADNGLVRNRYWCEQEDREVTFGEIGRGFELPDGRVIPVTDKELRALPLPTARAIELIAFIPAAAVDPLRIGAGYYLQPQGDIAAKPYLVLRHALQRTARVAVARYAWHGRERLGLLRVRGDVIALHGLLWPEEIRDPAAVVPPPVQLDEDEIDEAVALIDAMTRDDLIGPEFADGYTEALHAVIEAKQEDRQPLEAPVPVSRPGQLVDLMAALQESVSKARAARGETRHGRAQGAGPAREEGTLPEDLLEERRARGRSARYASTLTCHGRGHGRGLATVVGAMVRACRRSSRSGSSHPGPAYAPRRGTGRTATGRRGTARLGGQGHPVVDFHGPPSVDVHQQAVQRSSDQFGVGPVRERAGVVVVVAVDAAVAQLLVSVHAVQPRSRHRQRPRRRARPDPPSSRPGRARRAHRAFGSASRERRSSPSPRPATRHTGSSGPCLVSCPSVVVATMIR